MIKLLIMDYFQLKPKEQQSKDTIFDMNPYLNQHILEIFNPKMLEHLLMYNIKYSSVAQYIIDDNTTELKAETLTRAIFNHFGTRKEVNFLYPSVNRALYKWYIKNNLSTKPKKFTDEELKLHKKEYNKSYAQSVNGKKSQYERTKRYRDKKNTEKMIL